MDERVRICSLNVVPLDDVQEIIKETIRKEIKTALSGVGASAVSGTNSESQAELYTRQETADRLKVSLATLDNWTRLGIIKAQKIGTRIRYTRKAIDEALKNVANKGGTY